MLPLFPGNRAFVNGVYAGVVACVFSNGASNHAVYYMKNGYARVDHDVATVRAGQRTWNQRRGNRLHD